MSLAGALPVPYLCCTIPKSSVCLKNLPAASAPYLARDIVLCHHPSFNFYLKHTQSPYLCVSCDRLLCCINTNPLWPFLVWEFDGCLCDTLCENSQPLAVTWWLGSLCGSVSNRCSGSNGGLGYSNEAVCNGSWDPIRDRLNLSPKSNSSFILNYFVLIYFVYYFVLTIVVDLILTAYDKFPTSCSINCATSFQC